MSSSSEEAVVAWNAPPPYHPDAKCFINHTLDNIFVDKDGNPRPRNFIHNDRHHIHRQGGGQGQVVNRLRLVRPRLPRMAYDTGADDL